MNLIEIFNNNLLFDGMEENYCESNFIYTSKINQNKINFSSTDFSYIDELINKIGHENFKEIINKIQSATPSKYFPNLYTGTDKLALRFLLKELDDKTFLIIVSSGEFQPARYKLYLEGIWDVSEI